MQWRSIFERIKLSFCLCDQCFDLAGGQIVAKSTNDYRMILVASKYLRYYITGLIEQLKAEPITNYV